jgi:rSAM/selenodomain-associated transferase 1
VCTPAGLRRPSTIQLVRALYLFAKRPRAGRVKTRLVPPLRDEQAVELSRAMLVDQLAFVEQHADDTLRCELWTDGPWGAEDGPYPALPLRLQGRGDLGRRMSRAMAAGQAAGARVTAILGADAPTLPWTRIVEAFDLVERARCAASVVPASDGGYVLVAAREAYAPLFRDIPWGSPDVLALTRERATSAGVRLGETAPWYDADDLVDLRRLARDLATPEARTRAPATARLLDTLDLDALSASVVE